MGTDLPEESLEYTCGTASTSKQKFLLKYLHTCDPSSGAMHLAYLVTRGTNQVLDLLAREFFSAFRSVHVADPVIAPPVFENLRVLRPVAPPQNRSQSTTTDHSGSQVIKQYSSRVELVGKSHVLDTGRLPSAYDARSHRS